jgi:[ribosomal protein S18]-alanine N-acetyltransferase
VTPQLRRAAKADIPALLEIEKGSFPRPHWPAKDFFRFETVVAVVENSVVGFIVVHEIFAGDVNARREREILNVAVAPAFRRRGIATLLLREELRSGAIYFLEVRESNVVARKLYALLGFKEVGRRKGYYDNPSETAIVMQVK